MEILATVSPVVVSLSSTFWSNEFLSKLKKVGALLRNIHCSVGVISIVNNCPSSDFFCLHFATFWWSIIRGKGRNQRKDSWPEKPSGRDTNDACLLSTYRDQSQDFICINLINLPGNPMGAVIMTSFYI